MTTPTPPPGYKLVKGIEMNKNYTLKELADIAESTAKDADKNSKESKWGSKLTEKERWGFIWREVTKSILDAIGYEFPKDEEREAFEDWLKCNPCWDKRDDDVAFFAWKAGREELRRKEYLDKQPSEPAWIPWAGGECPLPDGVKRWEVECRDGSVYTLSSVLKCYNWNHVGMSGDIVAYRVLEV